MENNIKKVIQILTTGTRPVSASNGPKMNKSEMESISRALKMQVNAAKAAIKAYAPKLKAEFELQLMTEYPPSGDPVWTEALNTVLGVYETQRARVEARSEELRIPERFRPHLTRPGWISGYRSCGPDLKEYQDEMRRLHSIQVDDMIQSRLVQLDMDSAAIQMELAAHGCITDAAKQFFDRLPKIESLIPKLTVNEVEGLIEGRAIAVPPVQLDAPAKLLPLPPSDELPQLPASDEHVS
jgi:hypothetical protein